MKGPRFATMGVYGTTEESFFEALQKFGATDFVDIRRRRGLRGPLYVYANSARLQRRLAELGIDYHHELGLAPSSELLKFQHAVDAKTGAPARGRKELDPAYVERYRGTCLAAFDLPGFIARFARDRRIVLFCVEHEPRTCHRSLAAAEIARLLKSRLPDITP